MAEELPWDKLIAIATEELKQNVTHANYDGYQHYSFISWTGHINSKFGSCYGNIPCGGKQNNAIFADYSWNNLKNRTKISNEIIEEYLQWWANDSFVAPAFITKAPQDIIDNGALFDCKFPGALVVIAGMGIRMIKLHPDVIEKWYKFKKYIGPDAAICAAHVLYRVDNRNWIFSPIQSWFTIDAYKEQMKRIVNKDPLINKNSPFRTNTQYWPLSQVFNCTSQGGYLLTEIYPFPKGENFEIKDSFGKVIKSTKNVYTESMLEETLKEYVKMHMEL